MGDLYSRVMAKLYREANRDKVRAHAKKYYEANREKLRAYQKERYWKAKSMGLREDYSVVEKVPVYPIEEVLKKAII